MIAGCPSMRMIDVGVTGGVGEGKSFICALFEKMGASIIDADTIGHRLLREDLQVQNALLSVFGSQIRNEEGQISRQLLGRLVFMNPPHLRRLNEITHPFILQGIARELSLRRVQYPSQLMIVEAPLLFEARLEKYFQRIVVVHAPDKLRLERILRRPEMTNERALQIIHAQIASEEKRRWADFVIDNSSEIERVASQVYKIFLQIAVQLGKEGPCALPSVVMTTCLPDGSY